MFNQNLTRNEAPLSTPVLLPVLTCTACGDACGYRFAGICLTCELDRIELMLGEREADEMLIARYEEEEGSGVETVCTCGID